MPSLDSVGGVLGRVPARAALATGAVVAALVLAAMASASVRAPSASATPAPAQEPAPTATPPDTVYVPKLRVLSDEAVAAQTAVAGLTRGDVQRFRESGERLLAATDQAVVMLRTYRDAKHRFGLDEEWNRVNTTLGKVRSGATAYDKVTFAARKEKPYTAAVLQRELAKLRRKYEAQWIREIVETKVGRWLGEEHVTGIVTAPHLRVARDRLIRAVRARVTQELNAIASRALRSPIDVAQPLGPQLRQAFQTRIREAASRWLTRVFFRANPNLALVILSSVVVRILEPHLKELLRGKGNVEQRTKRTIAGFGNRCRALETLQKTGNEAQLKAVRNQLRLATRALGATVFLKKDLARAQRRGSKKAGQNLRAIKTGEKELAKCTRVPHDVGGFGRLGGRIPTLLCCQGERRCPAPRSRVDR